MSIANFTRIKHDVNGNPRYVCSWCGFGFKTYAEAIRAANIIGGRKYSTKSFGGGLVFQAYAVELEYINHRLAKLGVELAEVTA